MLLITAFVELRVVAERRRTRAGHPHAVFGRPMLIQTFHASLCCGLEKSISERHGAGVAWRVCDTNTAALFISSGKDSILTLIDTVWHENGMGTAWFM
jgi:hypothetical protein